jgi:hypothetical protein
MSKSIPAIEKEWRKRVSFDFGEGGMKQPEGFGDSGSPPFRRPGIVCASVPGRRFFSLPIKARPFAADSAMPSGGWLAVNATTPAIPAP